MINNFSLVKNQVKEILSLSWDLSEDANPVLHQLMEDQKPYISYWYERFINQLQKSKMGYPLTDVFDTPQLQNELNKIGTSLESRGYAQQKTKVPRVYLSHDLDYLKPTFQLKIKSRIHNRKFLYRFQEKNFLESIEYFLDLDSSYGVNPHCFIPCPIRLRNPLQRWRQWIIDPSYNTEDSLFADMKDLLQKYKARVGIHGSIYSLSEKIFNREKQQLSDSLGSKIISSRQHWLHLNHFSYFRDLYESGIRVDSTMGWNAHIGYRGGIAEPFPIVLDSNGNHLLEIPLLLMDGVLFSDMGLSESQALSQSLDILQKVKKVGGGVSINWHGRVASSNYQWHRVYKSILKWLTEEGFQFCQFAEQ